MLVSFSLSWNTTSVRTTKMPPDMIHWMPSSVASRRLLNTKPTGPLANGDTPGVICFWAAPDRIDVATVGNILGMRLESLLSMQGAGPLQMMNMRAAR